VTSLVRVRATALVASVSLVAAGALGGCSVSTTTTPSSVSATPTASGTPSPEATAPELDLQLRPVLDIANAQAGQCGETPPPTPDPQAPAQLCSQDRILLYSLGPAGVTGARVTSVEATMTSRTPQIQVKLDAQGGASLTRLTAEGMVQPAPRNRLAIVSHGRVQSAPAITDVIDGAVLVITGFPTVEDAQTAVDFLLR
jgi:preprotein translocase subunit SecD